MSLPNGHNPPRGPGSERRHRIEDSALLEAARAWVRDVHPNAEHLLRTEDWLLSLSPGAREPLRLAAVLHDIELAFPDETATWDYPRDWNSPEYIRWHQDRCAEVASRWLRDNDGPVDEVADLIRVHEVGGWPAADLLQAADSLSFLETLVPLVLEWPRASAVAKLDDAVARMKVGREHALALRDAAGTLLNSQLLRDGRMYRLALDRVPKSEGAHIEAQTTEIAPLWRRGVLYDVAARRGLEEPPEGSVVDADELEAIEREAGVACGPGDVVLVRGAGPDSGAARLFSERGVAAFGSDADSVDPQTLIEEGVVIMSSLYLEELAAAGVREFLFVALPLGIRGATGSMIDPVAVT